MSKSIRIRGSSSLPAENKDYRAQISGIVRDKQSNQALPGVFIKVKGTNIATVTDINGKFKLAVPDPQQTLEVSFVGFDHASVKVNSNDSVVIAMNPASLALNEVAVVRYGSKKDNDDLADNQNREVAPANGWEEYNKYIKENAIVSKGQKGTVVLSFSVSSNGSLSDFKIIKTDRPSLNLQAIKLVSDGPQWRGPKAGTQKVRLRIKFKEVED
nr:carboxypeptidase-like regulatory domain-containing protein [Pedobacter sp. SYSU D00873]